MKHLLSEELRGSLGGLSRKSTAVEASEYTSAIYPIVWIVLGWIGHAETGTERRKYQRGWTTCLANVNRELIPGAYLQEEHPDTIGQKIAAWLKTLH
jgi:hypothetical protein